ncbi:lipopolysaccharide biosynthesis protein [Xanthomonas cerealis pv. cerealis]|uniref:lipopolysaccharide biosynthesis protein n=1 Tax=Xanthomonas cerealis TaxID=3390025 RepID=UPI001F3CEA36|nr:lipopolysaccharide biosynthesis protein [Xanthomonas translucens]UKE70333.1 lipopolysaccharide biosynthesis protein [Xanthomonas translucens pv. pistacia]
MKGPIARTTLLTSCVFGLRLVLQAATLLVVTRLLGPSAYGAFSGVAALALFLGALAAFGFPLILMRAVSRDPTTRGEVLPFALPTIALSGALLTAMFVVSCLLLFPAAGISIAVLLSIGVAEILLQPLLLICAAEWHGRGRVVFAQCLQLLPLGLRLAAAMVVMQLTPQAPLTPFAVGYLLASLIAVTLSVMALPVRWPAPSIWRLPLPHEMREAFGYAATELTRNGPTELDKTLAVRCLPIHQAGLYGAGTRMMGAAVLPVIAMAVSALPRLFRESRDGASVSARLIHWMTGFALGYGTLLSIVLWFLAPWADRLLGSAYAGAGALLQLLCIVIPGLSLRLVFGNILVAVGRPWMRVGCEGLGILALMLVGSILSASQGISGMAIALACSEWGMAVLGGWFVMRRGDAGMVKVLRGGKTDEGIVRRPK